MVSVAIDGPAGAGKSSIAKAVSQAMGYLYVDTGALYRAIGLFAVRNGIIPSDAENLIPRLNEIQIELVHKEGEQRILMNGEDVSEEIRLPEMGMAASDVSAIPAVRAFLLEMQRDMAKKYNVVMDGRDIGTVVLPDAKVKIFLTATPQARARRRYEEHIAKGQQVSYNEVEKDLLQRDYNDSHRAIAPLKQAGDAVLADTSDLSLEESIRLVLDIIKDGIK